MRYGEGALTTNRIVQRAGVSIGTLYQYFDNKEAVVLAMLAREREQIMSTLDSLLSNTNSDIAFVLTCLLADTLRSVSLKDWPSLGTAEFEEELFNACWEAMQAVESALITASQQDLKL